MRCARVENLADRYVDGTLPQALAREVADHESRCARCAARIQAARDLVVAFSREPALRAPSGFVEGVMGAVYREALAGSRAEPGSAAVAGSRGSARSGQPVEAGLSRVYRRLGFCFMLSAAALVACLIVPRAFYPLQPEAVAARLSSRETSLVKEAIGGADRAVSGVLRSIGGVEK